jgi:multicomponent Na+:H+ antiporter subunit D
MSWDDYIPLLTLLTSLIPAVVIFFLAEQRVRLRTEINMAGATLKLALIALMLWGVFHERTYEFQYPILPGIDLSLRADALAMFFVTLSGVLWFLTTIYAIAYLEGSPHRSRFFGFFSLCVSATIGIALAGNLFTFVTFYELLTLATYPLVVHRQTETSLRAGRTYLVYTLGGGALLLAGAVWLHALVPYVDFNAGASLAGLDGDQDSTLRIIFVMLIAGLGVKAALIPLHGWLPQAMVAPAPVSALLHAVAVVKAGAFGIVRVVYDVYGIDRAYALGLTLPLAVWASATIVYASIRALFQDDLKRRLAFSTIAQVSYIILGVAVIGPSSTVGGIVHLVHQGLMKITLFFCAGNLAETLGIHKISEMHGVGRRMPWTMTAFTAGALGMIGVPPVCGFISKWYLGAGAIEASQYWVLVVLAASSALNAAYFLPIVYLAWFCQPKGDWSSNRSRHGAETAWGLLLPTMTTAALAIGAGLLAGAPFSPLQWASLIVERAYGRAIMDFGIGGIVSSFSLDSSLILLALGSPLLIACLLQCRLTRRFALSTAALAALPALVLACFAKQGAAIGMSWALLHMHLALDATGQTFMLFTALIWLFAGIYARGYLADDPRFPRFFFYFLLAMAGNFGVVLSRDMASFYLFFAMMSFCSYPLVVHYGRDESLRAGRVYIVFVVIGELALFTGMLLSTVVRGSLLFDEGVANLATTPARHVIVALFLIGFGIKTGMLPFHVWLPLAYPAAPIPAAAALSGAMIKAGVLGWLRFLPLGDAAMPNWGNACLFVGLLTALYGVVIGLTQRNAKTVLAYSSISQMGLIFLAVGAGLIDPAAWPAILAAVLIYTLHHSLAKACLFLSVGLAPYATGAAWRKRLWQAAFVFPALALAGAPLTIGAISKTSLKYSLAALADDWARTIDLLLPLASVGTTLLMMRFLYLIWPHSDRAAARPSPTVLCSWLACLCAIAVAAWLIPETTYTGTRLLMNTITWANLWPICLGGAIAWGVSRRWPLIRTIVLPSIPAGDILNPWQRAQQAVVAWLRPNLIGFRDRCFPPRLTPRTVADTEALPRFAYAAEKSLASWPAAGIAMLTLLGTCLFLLAWN